MGYNEAHPPNHGYVKAMPGILEKTVKMIFEDDIYVVAILRTGARRR
ncbi:MAG: hypothetical protein HPY71_03615 [Firmicutes bacterium]|nr:hypothetical protein [Bacillota bacterium]